MRFFKNGPNLPDELLVAQDDKRVVFFCGSGVSVARAGLPDFGGLTEGVLQYLKTDNQDAARRVYEAAKKLEKESQVEGLFSADHIFSLLERNFDRRTINNAVAKSLKPKSSNPDLSAHKIILKLARQNDGHVRLITTNFDRLFERAQPKVQSCTRSSLPHVQFNDDDWGIVHLHGRINLDHSGPDQDGFVLSRAEFGDAYLAQGWARDFVQNVLDKFIPVFIGYSAEDPPVRYLLEGLMQAGEKHREMYAFQSGPADEAIARWDEKGVQAIPYDPEGHHKNLWDSLEAWGKRSSDPLAWRTRTLKMARKGPERLVPHQRGMVAHIIATRKGAIALKNFTPPIPATWLCVFDPSIRFDKPAQADGPLSKSKIVDPYELYALDDDPPPIGKNEKFSDKKVPKDAWSGFVPNVADKNELGDDQISNLFGCWSQNIPRLPRRLSAIGEWIGKVSNQPAAVWWVAKKGTLHSDVCHYVRVTLRHDESKKMHQAVRQGWRLLFEVIESNDTDRSFRFDLQSEIDVCGWTPYVTRQYAQLISPTLKLGNTYRGPCPPASLRGLTTRDMLRVSVKYPERITDIEVPDEQLRPILRLQMANLERAVELANEFSSWVDVCSIEPDERPQNDGFSRTYELSGYVIHFTNLFRRLAEHDPLAASDEYKSWLSRDQIFKRLRFWAAGMLELGTGIEFAAEILALDRTTIWHQRNERDLLLSLAKRWGDIPGIERKKLEKKILLGPKKYRGETSEKHTLRSAHHRLTWLHWLALNGCEFSFDLEKRSQKLQAEAPDWKQEYAEGAANNYEGGSGWVKTDKNWDVLVSVPIPEIIKQAERSQGRKGDRFVDYDPFAGLSEHRPLVAISALSYEFRHDKYPVKYWEKFLSAEARKNDCLRLKSLIAGRLAQLPPEQFNVILHTASRWFKAVGIELRANTNIVFERTWLAFLKAIEDHPEDSDSALVVQGDNDPDWVGEAINSPAGHLAELVMQDEEKEGTKPKKGLPKSWTALVRQLLTLPGDSRRYALVIFAYNLSWFYHVDKKFAESTFKAIFDAISGGNSNADADAIWAGFFWGARTPRAALFFRLKPKLLEMADQKSNLQRRHGETLSGILLSGWGSRNDDNGERFISDQELRVALLASDDDFRSRVLWQLERWGENADGIWADQIVTFLNNVWPKHKKARTPTISNRLCDLAFAQKERFPEVSEAVRQLIGRVDGEQLFLPSIRDREGALVKNHPKSVLDLLFAILPEDASRWPYGAFEIVRELEKPEHSVSTDPKLIELGYRLSDI